MSATRCETAHRRVDARPLPECRPRPDARGLRRCAGSGRGHRRTACPAVAVSNARCADGGTYWRQTLSAMACTHHGGLTRARPASPATKLANSALAASLLTFGRRARSDAAASAASARYASQLFRRVHAGRSRIVGRSALRALRRVGVHRPIRRRPDRCARRRAGRVRLPRGLRRPRGREWLGSPCPRWSSPG